MKKLLVKKWSVLEVDGNCFENLKYEKNNLGKIICIISESENCAAISITCNSEMVRKDVESDNQK
jgi:hypothetical protein